MQALVWFVLVCFLLVVYCWMFRLRDFVGFVICNLLGRSFPCYLNINLLLCCVCILLILVCSLVDLVYCCVFTCDAGGCLYFVVI